MEVNFGADCPGTEQLPLPLYEGLLGIKTFSASHQQLDKTI